MRTIHAKVPDAEVGVISAKPSIARWDMVKNFMALNVLLKQLDREDDKLVFIDIEQKMLGPDGQPDPEIFVADGLHLSPKGYAIWTAAVTPFLRQ
jgi:hypothetical protein